MTLPVRLLLVWSFKKEKKKTRFHHYTVANRKARLRAYFLINHRGPSFDIFFNIIPP